MNRTFIILALLLMPIFASAQLLENLDYISPAHENLVAIKKGDQWAFINTDGELVIGFRKGLVLTETEQGAYPMFSDGRCLVIEEKKGIPYYGYMDTSGQLAIKPQYLNASNFKNGRAIVLKLNEEEAGRNEALDKRIVYYRYFEVVIDPDGDVKTYLTKKGTNVVLDKKFYPKKPKITSRFISDRAYAVRNDKNKWDVRHINQ